MKYSSQTRRYTVALLSAIAATLVPTLGHAQFTNQSWDGGANTWDAGVTQDWDGGANTWTNGNYANFGGGSAPTVSGTVVAAQLNSTGPTTISGGTIDLAGDATGSGYTSINDFGGPFTITSQIELGLSGPDKQYFINNNTNTALTIGNVDFATDGANGRFQLDANDGGGAITLNGTYTNSSGGGANFGFGNNGTGVYNIASTADFSGYNGAFSMTGDVLNIQNSSFNGSNTISFYTAATGNQLNIVGAQTINLSVYSSQKNDGSLGTDPDGVGINGHMKFTQSTADQSTWSGYVNANGSNVDVAAVSGGRLNYASNIFNTSMPLGMTINSATSDTGVVVISSNLNNYGLQDGNGVLQPSSTVAATIAHGTALITNTSGSAFGNNAGTVQLASGATLGGTGISTQLIVAAGPGSIIAPGDAGQANLGIAPTTGTLTLVGGLDTSNGGATLDFKIDGLNNDKLSFASGDFIPTGTLNINLFNMGSQDSILSNHYYTLIDPSAGTLDDSGATLNIVAPYGYAVEDVQFGTFTGLEVELIAAPEPSTYALMLGGLGFLAFCLRRKNHASV